LDSPHASVRRVEEEPLFLACNIEPELVETDKRHYPVTWEFSPDDKTFGALPDGIFQEGDRIKFDHVRKAHRGFYRCSLNNISFTVLLRVKG
jgi:hypothetical protein